jgi:GR25 family glycosyltransferase involved in LPS biosynthesis
VNNTWDFFSKIYCINLPEDINRTNFMIDEFNKLDIISKVNFIAANRPPPKYKSSNYQFAGEFGCALSHLKAIIDGINSTNPIVIFEDDAEFINNAENNIKNIIENLPENWSIIWLGGLPREKLIKYNDYLCNVGEFVQLVGYIVNPTHIKPIINFILDNISQPFPNACIDNIINNYTLINKSGYCSYPPIVSQVDGYSTLRQGNRFYKNLVNDKWKKYVNF